MIRQVYITGVRGLKKIADVTGLLAVSERSKNPTVLWMRSLLSIYDSADMVKLDVPWWTYPAIDLVSAYIDKRDGNLRVFEYGSGASTVWLARRCRQVITVEHDAAFAEHMRPIFAQHSNIELLVRPPQAISPTSISRSNRHGYENNSFDNYVDSIDGFEGTFDIIVIDGRSRIHCLRKAITRVSPGGLIVFDNSNRDEYRAAITNCGLRETALRGLAPALPYHSLTSILERSAP